MPSDISWPLAVPVEDTGIVWRFSMAFILVSVLAFMRMQYGQRISNNLRAYITPRYLRLLTRDDFNLFHPYSLISFLLLCISVSILVHQYCSYRQYNVLLPAGWKFNPVILVLILAAGLGLFLTFRAILYALVMRVLGQDAGQLENRYAHIVFGQVTGLIITPLAILSLFADHIYLNIWCYAGLSLLIASYIYRQVRGIITALNQQVSAIYIIYYLCTLEIVPAAIITGVLIRLM